MYKAIEIAYWFLNYNYAMRKDLIASNEQFDVYDGLTHLKLQKLLYNAQGMSLAINNKPLFEEPLEAWQHGPVVDSVYNVFSVFGRNEIIVPNTHEIEEMTWKIENDSETEDVLEKTYNAFIKYTAWELRELSHLPNSPWSHTQLGDIIDNELIKKYFKEKVLKDIGYEE